MRIISAMKKLFIFTYIIYIIFNPFFSLARAFAAEPDPPAGPDSSAEASALPLIIRAVNPGYTIAGKQNVGEFIELAHTSAATLPLDDVAIYYTNSSGTRSELLSFPSGSQMVGTNLLLRFAGSPDASASDLTYKSTLAMKAGPLELTYKGTVIDTLCWTGATGCATEFKSVTPTTLVRDSSSVNFEHLLSYTPAYDSENPSYLAPLEPSEPTETIPEPLSKPQCRGLEFTELLSYYEHDPSEQFLELYNGTDEPIQLTGCAVRYKKKTYPLAGVINPGDYFSYTPTVTFTKNPTSANLIELLDTTGEVLDKIEYPHGQKKSAAYAVFGSGTGKQWQITYQPTPGSPNVFQEFRSCPTGKVINEATGNCVKSSTLSKVATDCPAGQYRNPETGRCKKYNTSDSASECKAGYERNPETGRCKKIKDNTGAGFGLTPATAEETTSFVALGFVALIIALGLAYVIFQFRKEIIGFFRKLLYNIKHETPRQRATTSHQSRNRHHPLGAGKNPQK